MVVLTSQVLDLPLYQRDSSKGSLLPRWYRDLCFLCYHQKPKSSESFKEQAVLQCCCLHKLKSPLHFHYRLVFCPKYCEMPTSWLVSSTPPDREGDCWPMSKKVEKDID